jgi:CheY-like chemotaxis protein
MVEDPICIVCLLPIAPGGSVLFQPAGMIHLACLAEEITRRTADPARSVRPCILIIDADPQVRDFLGAAVKRLGYESHQAADGVQGLMLLAQHRYALLIIDLRMPKITGWEILEAVSRREYRPPMVLISEFITSKDKAMARQAGVALLRKPLSVARLKRAIEKKLAGQRGDTPRKPLRKSRASDSPEADRLREAPASSAHHGSSDAATA